MHFPSDDKFSHSTGTNQTITTWTLNLPRPLMKFRRQVCAIKRYPISWEGSILDSQPEAQHFKIHHHLPFPQLRKEVALLYLLSVWKRLTDTCTHWGVCKVSAAASTTKKQFLTSYIQEASVRNSVLYLWKPLRKYLDITWADQRQRVLVSVV